MKNRFTLAASVATLVGLGLAAPARADVKVNPIFSDNAVLQQGEKLAVWGTTDSAEKITVAIGGRSVEAAIDGKKWRAELAPLQAGGPHVLSVSQAEKKIELKNVLVGEVWLCGGQSNMEWPVNASAEPEKVKAEANNDQIRLFIVQKKDKSQTPLEEVVGGKWVVCSPETVGNFSAVGYAFGKDVQKATGAPVGLIGSYWGGTTAERWLSPRALEANPSLQGLSTPQGIHDLYNGMIAPLTGYGVRGAIWYQGESNGNRGFQYRTLLKAMIDDWRRTFGKQGKEFPFFIVQLAPFMQSNPQPTESEWAEVREAQTHVALTHPGTAVAVITDLGDEKDIHPRRKREVGERLALAAKALVYGQKVEYSGPVFDKLTVEGDKAVLSFTHVGAGLEAKGGELTGFTIAGEDKKFHNAQAKIEGDKVVVTSPNVPKPVAVRYGWANFPVVNLWNKDGLPASPFRTDEFPLLSQDRK